MGKFKKIIIEICPPVIWKGFSKIKNNKSPEKPAKKQVIVSTAENQDLDLYWDPAMAALLDTWGEDHVWNEIQMLLVEAEGKVLDIACGTGITINKVSQNKNVEVFGCDISDFFIDKAAERGIDRKRLKQCDATDMDGYENNSFDYSYSIGSLEHFTDKGIVKFVEEVHRITQKYSYHMVPVSKNGIDNGWITPYQSYFNNSEQWWLEKFKSKYSKVRSINSGWKDEISIGKWFVCSKD